MAQELRSIDISESPELLKLAQEVAETGVGRILRTEQGELAVLTPVRKARRRPRRDRPMTKDDGLYRLIGIGESEEGSDASERKHEILAQAYRPRA